MRNGWIEGKGQRMSKFVSWRLMAGETMPWYVRDPAVGRAHKLGVEIVTIRPLRPPTGGRCSSPALGPAGLKAAAVLAERGHLVTLCEAAPREGSQALLAQLLPGRGEFGGIVTKLVREVELAGVSLRRRTRVTCALIETEAPEVVVVATGGKPRRPLLPTRASLG